MKKLSLLILIFTLILQTSIVAQIKVNSNGQVGINNNSPSYRLDVGGNAKFTNSGYTITFEGASFGPSTANLISLGTSANRWYTSYTVTGYFTYSPVITSDLNYKTNIADLRGMNDKLKLLRPVSYKFKTDVEGVAIDKTNSSTQFGFIAQELMEIFPDMVKKDDGVLGISYIELIPVLVQALKEQQDEIDALNNRILILEQTK